MNIRRELICTARQAYADRLFAATSGNLSIFDRLHNFSCMAQRRLMCKTGQKF